MNYEAVYRTAPTTPGLLNITTEIESCPVMFGCIKVKFVDHEVYLGDVISAQGLEDSIQLTIERRALKNQRCNEVKPLWKILECKLWEVWQEPGTSGKLPSFPPSWPTAAVGSGWEEFIQYLE